MTGHKHPSKKKRKITRHAVTRSKIDAKKARPPGTPPSSLFITQSPTDVATSASTTIGFPASTARSPLADDSAIAEMVSGDLLRNLYVHEDADDNLGLQGRRLDMSLQQNESLGNEIIPINDTAKVDRVAGMRRVKQRVSKNDACTLNDKVVFPWLRSALLDTKQDGVASREGKVTDSASYIRTATNFFDPITYNRKVRVDTGKSVRLATQHSRGSNLAVVTPDHPDDANKPNFDIKKASKALPEIQWSSVLPTFALDSRKLRRYIVEDLMFADPENKERVMLLVSNRHPAFSKTWSSIYKEQGSMRVPITIYKEMYFQLEAQVVKNSKRQGFIDGIHTQDTVKYFVTYEGGEGVGLHFTGCSREMDLELKFASVLHETSTLMVWGTSKACRDYSNVIRKLRLQSSQELIYSRLLLELHGDHSQTLFLSSNYKLFSVDRDEALKKRELSKKVLFGDIENVISFGGAQYTDYVQHVDGIFREAVDDCYGKFVSLTEPIVSQTTIVRLVTMFKDQFPDQFAAIATLLNYNVHMKKARSDHLLPFYDKMVFYHFMSMCRVRCHRTFSWWALVNACTRYGSRTLSATDGIDSVFFGHSLVPVSVMRKTKGLRVIDDAYYNRILQRLDLLPILLAVFDNTQTGCPVKYQRNATSNSFLKMTAKMFVQVQYQWQSHDLKGPELQVQVPVTYLHQTIKSPYGMPRYETLLHLPPEHAILFVDQEEYTPVHGADFTGKRVSAYVQSIFLCEEMKAQQRFLSTPAFVPKFAEADFQEALEQCGLIHILQKNRSTDGLYARAHRFQRASVMKWKGEQTPAKLLSLPLSFDDETKTEECGNVLLSFLEMSGIIKVRGKDKTTIELADNYESKWQLTVGDGLSQMRMRQYHELVDAASTNFRSHYKQSIMFSKAMSRVLMIPGDLHGGGFHFLAVTFLLFYGGFLQPMQFALGWKRIRGSDVAKTYQQCATLALLVLGAVERGLYSRFVCDLVVAHGPGCLASFVEKPHECSSHIGKIFLQWMDERMAKTNDEVFKMCLLFTKLTRMYKLFRVSVRHGDAIMVEYLYEYYIPIWLMCGKNNYVEIGLNQIEDLYRRIPFDVLQAARENRFQPIHKGKDRDGDDMAEWALDAIMELLQIKYKAMNFPDSREGWQLHSTNMPLVARAQVFSQGEYTRMYDVEAYDEMHFEFVGSGEKQDKGNKKTQTKIPRRTKEKIMVAEILNLVDCFKETEGRKMTDDTFWKVLQNVTTTLEDPKTETEEESNMNGRSGGEKVLVGINQELVNNAPCDDECPDEVIDQNEMDQMEWFRVLEENDANMDDSDDEFMDEFVDADHDETTEPAARTTNESRNNTSTNSTSRNPTGESTHIITADSETEVLIGKTKKVNVTKAKFNRMGVSDVVEKGHQRMIEMKIPEVRFRRKCRIKRETKALQEELDDFLSNKHGKSKVDLIVASLDSETTAAKSNDRIEFRLMKKGLWIVPEATPTTI